MSGDEGDLPRGALPGGADPGAAKPEPERTREASAGIFRREALDHLNQPAHEGRVLQLSPSWTRWTFKLLCGACGVALIYGLLGHVREWATGPALIRVEGRVDVNARAAGTVTAVEVKPGQRVLTGDLLVRLYVAEEAAELQRNEREFELQLVKVLRDPVDGAARQALTTLRAQKELAQSRLDERTLRAPRPGVVSDVRIRAGQHLSAGDPVLSIIPGAEDARFEVIALLPGQYRPLLAPGMPLRLELTGYRYAWQQLVIDSVGDEVVGPAEVKRFLGADVGDTVKADGPVVLVQAHLPSRSFTAEGRSLAYYDGMPALAEAAVRSESILVTLVPALKALWPNG